MRVFRFDQVDLPLPPPVLELLLAGNRGEHVAMHLEPDEALYAVLAGKSFERSGPMLPQPHHQVRRYADVKRAVVPAGKDVDARIALLSHVSDSAARWTLKQVQGDGGTLAGGEPIP